MKPLRYFFAAAAVLCFVASPSWAQLPTKPGPPPQPANMLVWGGYIGAGLGLLAVGIAAIKPAKRTHQD